VGKLHFEDEAEMFAFRAWETLQLEPPVNLARLTDRLGIVVHEREFVEEIDGVYLRLPGAPPVIAINNSYVKPVTRRRFTLAHEIGHHLLSHRVSEDRRVFIIDDATSSRSVMERACDRFAALLLMPEHLMIRYYSDLTHNPGQRVAVMSARFGVSPPALRRRLRELGLDSRPRRRA
jgi:Zn-dependent peptidase ImmA (M78 family)